MGQEIIVFVDLINETAIKQLRAFNHKNNNKFKFALLHRYKEDKLSSSAKKRFTFFDYTIKTPFFSGSEKISKHLGSLREKVVAVSFRGESVIPKLKNVFPLFPSLNLPSFESLQKASDKSRMRACFKKYCPSFTPKHISFSTKDLPDIDEILQRVSLPVVVKPHNMRGSRLVRKATSPGELVNILEEYQNYSMNSRSDNDLYVIIEEYMNGTVYSTDAYVDDTGDAYFCPLVEYIHNKNSFTPFLRITPVLKNLSEREKEKAFRAAKASVEAVGLKNSSAHIELMHTKSGWKIIEIGPRLGGNRSFMYEKSYGINHNGNDILVKLGSEPKITKKKQTTSAVLFIYPTKAGRIEEITGLEESKNLQSVKNIEKSKKVSEKTSTAQKGSGQTIKFHLSHQEEYQVKKDIEWIKNNVEVIVNQN